jgi:hypothetical protein
MTEFSDAARALGRKKSARKTAACRENLKLARAALVRKLAEQNAQARMEK